MAEHIKAEIRRGTHPSSDTEEEMETLHFETKERVSNRYTKVIRYGYPKKDSLEKLKITPVAMIPYESQSYHTIMYIYFQLQHRGTRLQSVNSETVKQAPTESMIHLEQCV